jgi:hypothetical protein
MRIIALIVFGVCFASSLASSQTRNNPDISAIGDFRMKYHTDDTQGDSERLSLSDPSLEINVSGYLNPYSRADIAIAWHGEERAEIEEAYLTVLHGLPLDMQFRAGRYLLQFGRLNTTHEHVWSFIKRPLIHSMTFGDEGLRDIAFGGSFILPTGETYTELIATLTKGDALHAEEHGEEEPEGSGADEEAQSLGFFGRLTTSFAAGDNGELAFGASALNATNDALSSGAEAPRAWIVGIDAKYRRSLANSRSLQVEFEALAQRVENFGAEGDAEGAYLYIDYRFSGRHNAGVIIERINQTLADETAVSGRTVERSTSRVGIFAGFLPVEETLITRVAAHWTKPSYSEKFVEFTLQFLFGLGPHKIHTF